MFQKKIYYYKFALLTLFCATMLGSHLIGQDTLHFPEGTILTLNGDQIDYQLPEGYKLMGDVVGYPGVTMAAAPTGSIKCDCKDPENDENAKCHPFQTKDMAGCFIKDTSCKLCEMTSSSSSPGTRLNKIWIRPTIEDPSITGFIYMSGVHPVNSFEELVNMPSVKEEDIQDPVIRSWIDDIYTSELTPSEYQAVLNGEIPDGFEFVPYSINGKLGFIILNAERTGDYGTMGIGPIIPKDRFCTGCDRKCKFINNYGFYYCDGCSSGCTMNWKRELWQLGY
jgi:hypothetical protein